MLTMLQQKICKKSYRLLLSTDIVITTYVYLFLLLQLMNIKFDILFVRFILFLLDNPTCLVPQSYKHFI